MRRREFIVLLGATAYLPAVSQVNASKTPVVGYLCSISRDADANFRAAFWQGLAKHGFTENVNVKAIYRYADGQYERLAALVDELVEQQVDLIVTGPSSPAALAARHATSTIPIVFMLGADPVELGLVASYNKPGANVTGINVAPESLTAKRLELLDTLVPGSTLIAELVNPANKTVDTERKVATAAAKALGRELLLIDAKTAEDITPAFEHMKRKKIAGLVIWFEALFQNNRDHIVRLANQNHIITVFPTRNFADLGGLISYGPNFPTSYRQVGTYAGRILKGTHPSELPVMASTTFDLIINLKTARFLEVTIPPSILARADEVIE